MARKLVSETCARSDDEPLAVFLLTHSTMRHGFGPVMRRGAPVPGIVEVTALVMVMKVNSLGSPARFRKTR